MVYVDSKDLCDCGIYFIERQAILKLLTLSQCTAGDERKVVALFLGEFIATYFVLYYIVHAADWQYIRTYIYVTQFDLLLRRATESRASVMRGWEGASFSS